jgi:hypothetical protein
MRILMTAPQPFFRPRGTPFSVLHRIRALTKIKKRRMRSAVCASAGGFGRGCLVDCLPSCRFPDRIHFSADRL